MIAAVRRDHRQIEQLFARVETANGGDREEVFEDLAREPAVHETAEEKVVHPLTRPSAPAASATRPVGHRERVEGV